MQLFDFLPRGVFRAVGLLVFCVCAAISVGALPVVQAGYSMCRADPIVVLTNGTTIRMTADIATDPANVELITYTVHAPAGSSVKNIVYTGGPRAVKERVLFYADLPPAQYTTDTLVSLVANRPSAMVNTFTQLTSSGPVAKGTASASPGTGKHLLVRLQAH